MSLFCENARNLSEYPIGVFGEIRDEKTTLLIRCLQWGEKVPDGEEDVAFQSARELIDSAVPGRLRVAFLPNCCMSSSPADVKEHKELIRNYSISSEVLAERMRSVNHAFGSSTTASGDAEIAWCHFLCRRIDVRENKLQNFGYLRNDQGGQSQGKGALSLWIMCDFFLHAAKDGTVTLLCFGAPERIVKRFDEALVKDSWPDAIKEPYLLFGIVFDELHGLFDGLSGNLARALRRVEESAINQAGAPQLSFRDLHEVQKNCIFMIETAEALMSTLDAILESLRETTNPPPSSRAAILRAIAYRKRTFKSTLLKVYALEKRALSSIQVYQALVTQADSHAMKFIAVLTLVFLPVTGVSTVFSSPFFDVDFELESTPLRVARCFWKFWAVVAPLTLGLGLLCVFWFRFPNFFAGVREGWREVKKWEGLKARRKRSKSAIC